MRLTLDGKGEGATRRDVAAGITPHAPSSVGDGASLPVIGRVTLSLSRRCRHASLSRLSSAAGFTLIELIVVFAIIALLITLAVPRYFAHIERAKEATLKQDLSVLRDAIDKFYGDKGRYPDALDELAKERYIREVPADPFTESASSWVVLAPPSEAKAKGQVYDVKSGAEGKSADGTPYADW
jgi:general secretion pathway protein G